MKEDLGLKEDETIPIDEDERYIAFKMSNWSDFEKE